jgi:hypothetical protein
MLFTSLVTLGTKINVCLNSTRIILDFEIAIHNAVKLVWPTVQISGCRFHLAQSWYKKIQNLGLVTTYRQCDDKGKWLQHLFGLPYLTTERISECFVNNFMAELPNLNSFSKMADYLVDNYIGETSTFPPSLWASKSSHLYLTTNP